MSSNSGEIFSGGATTSQHVDAEDDDHFQNTTFKLKRTRSLGLLDEFIDSEQQEKDIEKRNEERDHKPCDSPSTRKIESDADSESATTPSPSMNSPPASSDSQSSPMLPANAFLTSPEILPHDDSDLVAEPSRHVDYLSHQWDVSDISKSWRYVISRRKNVANAARLENASWRTWAQKRSNLKTISPEEVNWSKESDVTWLYGPIVDDDDHDNESHGISEDSRSINTASSVVAGDISIARKTHRPKPILKKRTMEDIMISHANLLKLQIASARADQEQTRREDAAAQARREAAEKSGSTEKPPEYFDYNLISAKLNSQYKNFSEQNSRNNSSANLSSKSKDVSSENTGASPNEPLAKEAGDEHSKNTTSESAAKKERHIHFNDEVQQCIAIDEFSDDEYDEYDDDNNDYDYDDDDSYLYESHNSNILDHSENYEEDEDNEDEDDDDDEEAGFFLNIRSPSSASMTGASLPGLSSSNSQRTTSQDSTNDHTSELKSNSRSFKTIHILPPTTLSYGPNEESSDDSSLYRSSISHNVDNSSSRGYDYYYDYNTVYQVDPNHAIYGDSSRNKTPDVVDVPENIAVGSNFDYEIIENEDATGFDGASPELVGYSAHPNRVDSPDSAFDASEKLPINALDDSATQKSRANPFSFNSDSEDSASSDDEGTLSISARNSSQSLAQQVFGQPLTSAHSEESHYPEQLNEPKAKHISEINPNYSSSSICKQPHSSNSLSSQFFGEGMTKSSDDKQLSRSFFNTSSSDSQSSGTPTRSSFSGTQSPPVQKKSSPVPPHTTSANAFSGSKNSSQHRNTFDFNSGSDSDEESESDDLNTNDNTRRSYSSLYEVAGRNGITVPSGDEDSSKAKKGSAMTNFLGSWNKGG